MAKLTLQGTSTVYMDGTALYHIKWTHKPGIVSSITLKLDDALMLAALLEAGEWDG